MHAVVFEEFGGPEVLRTQDVAEPHAGPGEVRVSVRAAGVNPIDFKIRRGWTQGFIDVTFPATPGLEVAGVVDEVGEGAEFAIGDEVVGWSKTGSYAEHAVVGNVVPKPAGVSWEQAVGLPVAGETAQRVLDELGLKAGETLLLHGAAGAVGSIAVQLAKAAGATVIGTASPANHDFLRSIGATRSRTATGCSTGSARPHRRGSTRCSTPPARAGWRSRSSSAAAPTASSPSPTCRPARWASRSRRAARPHPRRSAPACRTSSRQLADGNLTVRVAETFALADAAKAQELSESGHAQGKVVVLP